MWWQFIWQVDLELVTLSKPLNWTHLSPWMSMGVSTISSKKERPFCYTWASLIATRSCPLCHCCVVFTWALTGDPLWPLHLPSSCLSFFISITELLVAIELTWCCGLKEWCSGLVVTILEARALEWPRRPALGMPVRDYQDQVKRDRLGDSLDCGQPSWTRRKGENKPAPVFTSPCFLTMDATWPAHLSSVSFHLPGCLAIVPEKLTNTCPGICMLWCQLTVWFFWVFFTESIRLTLLSYKKFCWLSRALCSTLWFCPYPPLGIWLWGWGAEMSNLSSSICFPLTEGNNGLCSWCPSLCSVDGVTNAPRGGWGAFSTSCFSFFFCHSAHPHFFCQESSENKVLLRLKGQGLVLHLLLLLVSPPRCENSAPWLLPGVRTGVTLVAEGAGGGGNHLQVIKIQR